MTTNSPFKKILFFFPLLLCQNLLGQLTFIQGKDSCILKDGNIEMASSSCTCNSLEKDTILIIKTLLNNAKSYGSSSLLYGYPYENNDIYPCSSADCRHIGDCAAQRNQFFCVHFYAYDVLFRQRQNKSHYIYIKSGKKRFLSNYNFKYCEHPYKNRAHKKSYIKNYNINPNDPRLKDVEKIKKLYKIWLIRIDQLGLQEARKQKIYPFNNTKYNWSMDLN